MYKIGVLMNESIAWQKLMVSDESDPKFLSKLIDYLSETSSSIFPEDPIENSFHMNEKEEIFVYKGGSWLEAEIVKNTEDYPGFEENAGAI